MLSKEIKQEIRRKFKFGFYDFFVQGFVFANLGIFTGIAYHTVDSKGMMFFYLFQPLFCMFLSYEVSFTLFYKGCQLPIKNLLHYIYIGIFSTAFCIGVIYYIIPIITPALLVSLVYGAVCSIELIYWNCYKRIYTFDFVSVLNKIKD